MILARLYSHRNSFAQRFYLQFATFFIAVSASAICLAATFNEVKAAYQPSDTLILDRHGELLHRLRTDATVRRGQWVALGDVSPALRTALVLSEDKRFYEHSGVDWQAVSSAAWGNLWNTKTRGASTITMQLTGLLDDDLKRASGGRSVVQKLGQTVSASWLERGWRKDQILEAYLNLVPFRGELVGIDALSRTLFGKAAHGLDKREAAVAAALVRAPNAKVPQVVQRACSVLQNLEPTTRADCEGLDLFVTGSLMHRDFDASDGIAPHVAVKVVAQPAPRNSRSITTTLSAPLQRFATESLQTHLRELSGQHVDDAAVVVLDKASGEVLAWVGSSGGLSQAPEVDFVSALRQPGSTLKPFLYGQAIAERRITAASLLEDSAAQIETSGGLYIPQNYDQHFKGWVSARTALGASLNVPAVRTLVMVTPDAFQKQLIALGLPLKQAGDFYGYSLALGSAEVSLLNLTNAYRALGNGGQWSETRWLPRAAGEPKPTSRQALDARAAFIVGDILSDPLARARTFGTDSLLATRAWTAVKTGTSKDLRDNWAVGWSQKYAVGVWVGNANGEPMWDVSGTTGAAPIWAAVMNYLHRPTLQQSSSRAPKPPAGVVQASVQFAKPDTRLGLEAPRQEWFIAGTQQASFAINSGAGSASAVWLGGSKGSQKPKAAIARARARITAPTNGTIIALDPDIPPQAQRLTLSAEGTGLRWRMDGKPLDAKLRAQVSANGNTVLWLPWPGRHVVQLVNAQGQVLDEIKLEVRGAGAARR